MKTELVVQGEKREVQEAVARFFREREDLYHGVTASGRFTDYRAVEAKVKVQHAKLAGWRAAAGIVAGLVAAETMRTITGNPRIEVVAKVVGGEVRLKLTTQDGVKPEAIDPLLQWLRQELNARPA